MSFPFSTNQQEDNEIPIWIRGEPRFISGIMSSTTCYELIQALIDDELHDRRNEKGNVGKCTVHVLMANAKIILGPPFEHTHIQLAYFIFIVGHGHCS